MTSKLSQTIAHLGARRHPAEAKPTTGGPSAYEQVTRQGLDDLIRQVERLETKLNGILLALAGSLLIDLYRALVR